MNELDHLRDIAEAAAWLVGPNPDEEELRGPFHEGAFRSLVRAVQAWHQHQHTS